MLSIKFQHNYPKLWWQTRAELIAIRDVVRAEITEDLLGYDARYIASDGSEKYFPLNGDRFLQLIFVGDKHIPFCTLRRYTPQKLSYYKSHIGEVFVVQITGGVE